ncbi:hypothetical protein A7982_12794 [Minicystis rosea]|nr:hypothetical protein A7982_12794 [Minicystis rosea]
MRDGFVVHTAEGALGGVLGTLLIKQTMALGRKMPEKLKPPAPSRDPAEVILNRLEGIRGRPLPWRTHDRVSTGLHWAYNIGWGSLLGLAVSGLHVKRPRDTVLAGAGLGALVWAVEYVAYLPGTGLVRPVHKQGAGRVLTSFVTHVAYGVAASLPILAIDRFRLSREPWWKRLADRVEIEPTVKRVKRLARRARR